MAEEANVVEEVEITPDDFTADEQDTAVESAPTKDEAKAEDKEPEVATEETEEVETKSEDAESETEDESKDEVVETEDKPQSKADERKAQLNTEIRDLVAQRNALKTEIEKATAEVYQPATESELLEQTNPDTGEFYTPAEAKIDALNQRLQVKEYNDKVTEQQLTLSSEAERVTRDFPIFDPNSPDFNEELHADASELMEKQLIRDPNVPEIGPDGKPTGRGIIIGSNVSPYILYKTLAKAATSSTLKGQIQGQKNAEKMLANADTPASSTPVGKKPVNPLDELWAEEL